MKRLLVFLALLPSLAVAQTGYTIHPPAVWVSAGYGENAGSVALGGRVWMIGIEVGYTGIGAEPIPHYTYRTDLSTPYTTHEYRESGPSAELLAMIDLAPEITVYAGGGVGKIKTQTLAKSKNITAYYWINDLPKTRDEWKPTITAGVHINASDHILFGIGYSMHRGLGGTIGYRF
jgi:opacity protein-like surface antigen